MSTDEDIDIILNKFTEEFRPVEIKEIINVILRYFKRIHNCIFYIYKNLS